jgi:hypothetical protein
LAAWQEVLRNEWCRLPDSVFSTLSYAPILAASDASTKGALGVVIYAPGSHVRFSSLTLEHGDAQGKHIYFLELKAALEAISRARKAFPQHPVILGCDNTAVIGTLRRGYSHLPVARELLSQHRDIMLEGAFQVFYLPSAENVADALSRRGDVIPEVEALTLARLLDVCVGVNRQRREREAMKGPCEPVAPGVNVPDDAAQFDLMLAPLGEAEAIGPQASGC